MYHQFNIQQFYVLPTQCIYVFCVDLRTNSYYFPIQHYLTGFYNRDLTLYSPVVTICTASLTFNNSTFCPHTEFMCFVWISEQTAIISLYNINWLVFITQTQSFYCAVRTEAINMEVIQVNSVCVKLNLLKSTQSTRGDKEVFHQNLFTFDFSYPLQVF